MGDKLAQLADLDRRLVGAAKSVKVLSNLNWEPEIRERFLKSYHKGSPNLPKVDYSKLNFDQNQDEFKTIMNLCDKEDPVGRYIHDTAESYLFAADMLEHVGTPRFTEFCGRVYGLPKDYISAKLTNMAVAEKVIKATDDYLRPCSMEEGNVCILADIVAEEIQAIADKHFTQHKVSVEVDHKLASKAAAGADRIRIRGSTCFSEEDIGQLIQHECLVHTLTKINGRHQPNLPSMGLGSPRTTGAQEGLAVFSELVTSVMNLSRLRRIALRVKAVQMGIDGADFLQVFKFFIDSGQSELESFQSASRIFRGGDVKGKVVFTKDAIYLRGLLNVHIFLSKAIKDEKMEYPSYLCAGRLALSDVVELEPYFKSGFISLPIYEPTWIKNKNCLAAFLLFGHFFNEVDLGVINLSDFRFRGI